MKRTNEQASKWVVDYSAQRAEAIKRLGDRYLLARPINAGHSGSLTNPVTLSSAPAEKPVEFAPRISH